MADSFTQVTSTSWLGRIGDSIKGVLLGLLFFVISFPVLFFNEGRAVKTAQSLSEGAASVVTIDPSKVDPAHEGKLVHLSADAQTSDVLTDPVFAITAPAIKLRRDVEMYQWKEDKHQETKKNLGGSDTTTTTYTYTKAWSKPLLDSGQFKEPAGHANPPSLPYDQLESTAKSVTAGAFTLSPGLLHQLDTYEPLPVTTAIPDTLKDKLKPDGSRFYLGADPATPQVGDARISFEVVKPGPVSVIAEQSGTTFAPYQTKAGRALEMLTPGTHSSAEMFKQAMDSNRNLTWILRLVGFALMAIGIGLVLRPLVVVADVIPFIGGILGAGVFVAALAVALPLSLLTIAIAWLVYRPLLGVALVVVAVAIIVGARKMFARKDAAGEHVAAAPQ